MAQDADALFVVKPTHAPADKNWLTGNEVIRRTGISKSDLIRFIQLGVFPKSMMRISSAGPDGSQKISYFSSAILGHVAMLKLLRDEGHSVETVVDELRQAEEALPMRTDYPSRQTGPAPSADQAAPEEHATRTFHLPTDSIAAAAFFVDQDLRIAWVKLDPGDRLVQAISNELNDDPSGTVFDIMLRASLKELVFNWQPLFDFIYRFLKVTTAPSRFNRLAPAVSLNLEAADLSKPALYDAFPKGPVASCPFHIEDAHGRVQEMRIYGVAVSQGALFVWEEERWQGADGEAVAGASEPVAGADGEPVAGKIPFGVLSVRLDDSRSIVDTLLPETYFELMTRIWDESDRVVAAYGGIRAKRGGTEVQYIIPRHATNRDPAYDAICCAVRLQSKMAEIEAALKSDQGWLFKIRLNIGISSGKDHLAPEDPTAGMAFMLPGGAADQAFHLSAIAQGGGIWVTKSAFSHLRPQQIKRITFGIHRDQRLIPHIFAQLSELPHDPDMPPPGRGIRSLFVTQIVDVQDDDPFSPYPGPNKP